MSAIQELMKNVNGSTFISLDVETPVKLRGGQKNPLQGRVTKYTIGCNVMVFSNKNCNGYENMVNRRLAAEGKAAEFEVGPRAWGERIDNTPFVVHNGTLYLEVIFLKAGVKSYLVDGKPASMFDRMFIEANLFEREEGNQDGLENKVIIRTFKVANIRRITINGTTYNM